MQSNQAVNIVQPKLTTLILSVIGVGLVLANIIINFVKYMTGDRFFYGLIPLFQLSAEHNIPAFFSGCLFLINALLLLLVWQTRRLKSQPHLMWLFLAGLFLFLSFDELFKVHEHLIEPVRNTLGTSGLLYFSWVIVYGLAVIILAAFFFPVWWRLNKTVKIWFALSAITYLSGVIGFEMLGGAHFERIGGQGDLIYGALYTIEEALEMAGLIMFVYSLMLLIQREFGGLIIQIPGQQR